ncbi:protein wech-like [Mya arenaria]|uniref:protein wech-like n=1 Tax=Mya arenaria TaxID=6604 RepID=UPI0022DFB6E8|nr:protein wech-like [Mya arenaria]
MDAVPGRKAPMESGSAPDPTYCQPCAGDGNKFLPEAFCPVCKEFLCSNCARVHRNQKITKTHVLQENSNMPSPNHVAESEDEKYTETCKLHAREFIKYFCPNHEDLLCGDCLAEKQVHRSCKVEKISQAAKRYKYDVEYIGIKTGLVQMVTDISKLSHDIKTGMKSVEEESLTNINELRKFRTEINKYLDKRENELLAEIDQKKQTSKMLLSDLKSKCTNIKSDSEKLKSELPAHEANNMHLFVVGKRTMKELAGLQTAMEDVDRKRKVPRCKFHRDPATEQLLAFKNAIGRLEEGKSTSALWQQHRQQEMKQQQHKRRLVTSQKGQNNRSIYQHLSSQNNALTEQGTINGLGQISFILTNLNQTLTSPLSFRIDKNNVVLEGGGQFEEGQAYMIRDRQGNARKMIWTKGDFMPLQEPDKSNYVGTEFNVTVGAG